MKKITQTILLLAFTIFFVVLVCLIAVYLALKSQCEDQNGFLYRTESGVQCIPYRNDMQKYGSYPQE